DPGAPGGGAEHRGPRRAEAPADRRRRRAAAGRRAGHAGAAERGRRGRGAPADRRAGLARDHPGAQPMIDERTPPARVRVTKLQEVQLRDLVQIDALTSAMYHDLGFDAAEVPQRSEKDLAALTRGHNVHVAEADHVPAGMLAWRDEAPG